MLPVPTTEPKLDMRTENEEVKVLCGGRKEPDVSVIYHTHRHNSVVGGRDRMSP